MGALALVLLLLKDNPYYLTLLIVTYVFAGLASAWNIIGGFAGQVNLGHAAFFGIGALVTRQLWLAGWPFVLTFVGSGLVALAFAGRQAAVV